MAVCYEEEIRNGKLVFLVDPESRTEAFELLYLNRIGIGIGYADNSILLRPIENATDEQIQEMRNALSQNVI